MDFYLHAPTVAPLGVEGIIISELTILTYENKALYNWFTAQNPESDSPVF
jgi:hypothetical protein